MTYLVSIDIFIMIKSFKCKYTAALFDREYVKRFSGFDRQALKRLYILDAADSLDALKALPSNRFESLLGDRVGQFSIRINLQWRICFTWNVGAENVEIVDYH